MVKKSPHPKKYNNCNEAKEILYLGNTVSGGSNHDFGLLKKEFKGQETWFENQNVHIDLGYLGFDGVFKTKTTHIPHKKPRKRSAAQSKNNPEPSLTKERKDENKVASALRVSAENTLSGVKRYTILTNKLRTHTSIVEDMSIEIAAGLWNFHQKKVNLKTKQR